MQPAAGVDQGAVLRQELHAVLPQRAQGERALAAAGRQHDRNRSLAPDESQGVQARLADRVEVLARPGDEIVVGRLVDKRRVVALHREASRAAVEHGDGPPEVVHDRALVLLEDDVARCHEGGRQVAEHVEVRRPALDLDLDPRQAPRRRLEPGKVEPEALDDLRPVAGHLDSQAIDIERCRGGH